MTPAAKEMYTSYPILCKVSMESIWWDETSQSLLPEPITLNWLSGQQLSKLQHKILTSMTEGETEFDVCLKPVCSVLSAHKCSNNSTIQSSSSDQNTNFINRSQLIKLHTYVSHLIFLKSGWGSN